MCQRRFLPFGQIIVALGNIACWRHGIGNWIAQVVYDRPDMESWWNKLQGQGVLGSYPRGGDVRVEHIEEEWLEAGEVELERRKSKQKKDAEAGDGPKAAVVAATVVEPGWDTPKGIANVGNSCYINTPIAQLL